MASSIVRQLLGNLSKKELKGSALIKAIGSTFSPGKIAKTGPETQVCKHPKK